MRVLTIDAPGSPTATTSAVEHPSSNVVAFADYVTEDYVYADKNSDDIEELGPARAEPMPSWRHGLEELHRLAGG